jgi:hypothetical protein
MSLSYSSFELLDEQKQEKENEKKRLYKLRQYKINKIVELNELIPLKSDYFDLNSYYYSKKHNKMYVVSNIGEKDEDPVFQVSNDCRILMLNNICNNKCGIQPIYK